MEDVKKAIQVAFQNLSVLKIEAQESGRLVQVFNALNFALKKLDEIEMPKVEETKADAAI